MTTALTRDGGGSPIERTALSILIDYWNNTQ